VEIAICKEIYEILETKNIFEQMIVNCEEITVSRIMTKIKLEININKDI
jgi:hypothetical protein